LAKGIFSGSISNYTFPLAIIALVAAVVESLPLRDIDNITITVAALITGYFLL
jgi:dolichol kinase